MVRRVLPSPQLAGRLAGRNAPSAGGSYPRPVPRLVLGGLLVVFAIHLVVFARLYLRRRQLRHGAATLTFALLVSAFSLRLWAEEWAVAGIPTHFVVRVAAWMAAGVSIPLFIRHLWARRRGPRS